MGKLSRYRTIAQQIMEQYARWTRSKDSADTAVVVDPARAHYEVIHVDIRNEKFWIQHDATDRPVADELVDTGVPREDIVLAFHPAELRQYTGFAVG